MVQTFAQPKVTVIALNGNQGLFVNIPCSRWSRYVEINECPPDKSTYVGDNYAPQGVNYSLPDDNFTEVFGLIAGNMLIRGSRDNPRDRAIGNPGWTDAFGQAAGGTIYCKMRSATVAVTQVEVREWS